METNITSQQIKDAILRAKTDTAFAEQLKQRLDTGRFDTQLSEIGLKRGATGLSKIEVGTLPSIEAQKLERQSQGLPVSVRDDRAEPTLAGSIVRGFAQAPVKAALSIPATVMGPKGVTIQSKYLGETSDIAKTIGDKGIKLGQRVKAGEITLPGAILRATGNAALETLDVAGAVPVGAGVKGIGIATDVISGGAKGFAKKVATEGGELLAKTKGTASKFIPTTEETIIDLVSPELSTKRAGQAIKAGRGKVDTGTIFDTVSVTPDSKIMKAYESVKDIVNPKGTVTENINIVRDSLSKEAELLKTKIKDIPSIFTFKELNSALRKVELPIAFKEDAQSKVLKKVTDTAMKIAQKRGGKLDSLLDARKEFDRLVEENFPNLYEAGKPTPAYNAITKTRNALNDFIESKLPDGFGYKESLRKQSSFYDALDAMESKAGKEFGKPTNRIIRKAKEVLKKNPKATSVGKALGTGVAGYGILRGITGD